MEKQNFYTHGGLFHADEVVGYTIVDGAVGASLHRLTDINNIPDDGIVGDIGREYNKSKDRYDHHQGWLTRENGYPYATAGLLWENYGISFIRNILGNNPEVIKSFNFIWKRIDERIIQGIDAHDADSEFSLTANCSAGEVQIVSLSILISNMNGDDSQNQEEQFTNFKKASELVFNFLKKSVINYHKQYQDFNKFESVAEFHENNQIIILSESISFREIVHEKHPDTVFVISPSTHPGNKYSMIAISVHPNSRKLKKSIERPDWFKSFIHQGKWIAGGESVDILLSLAVFNLDLK